MDLTTRSSNKTDQASSKLRGQDWNLRPLNVPEHIDFHVVCDNYGTHKHPTVKTWLAGHPRFHMHFTPTYSSWINQIERLFAEVTRTSSNAPSTAQTLWLSVPMLLWCMDLQSVDAGLLASHRDPQASTGERFRESSHRGRARSHRGSEFILPRDDDLSDDQQNSCGRRDSDERAEHAEQSAASEGRDDDNHARHLDGTVHDVRADYVGLDLHVDEVVDDREDHVSVAA